MAACPACGKENPEGFQFCGFCTAPLTGESREQRKTVTVLFCDLTGSTALGESIDPEALRALLARYFERMKAIVESHGGTVEKFIGDAVMAVFGVPVVHEDDALRACRAAVEMRDAFPGLGLEGRIGIATGEVVTGTEERLATGDAVNVAARLEQAAAPGEILIGGGTLALVRAAVDVEPAGPLELKGKAEPVVAHRLVAAAGGASRRHEAPMVGRVREQRLLADAWERVVSERSCHLFTILGPAGVGKSRLVAEFLGSLGAATVLRGRCLPYGEGITYWPIVEVVKQLDDLPAEPAAAEAIRSLLRESEAPARSEEIAWAVRKLLEQAAAEQRVVCVLDDVHWGEETFLDLVEHVADLSRQAPILLVCMARPDLLDRRPGWAGGKVNATTVLLEPLDPAETDALLDSLSDLDEPLRERIREASEGNPLFVEEMVAMIGDSSDGEIAVPPTIQALLAARLDQLDADERDVLQCGSVEGRVFHRGGVQAVAPDAQDVATRLTSLVRKELVRPNPPLFPGEDAFRFRHLLIRDAAYDALPRAVRAELHERFADWLGRQAADLVEQDEIVGYHLEQAYRHRVALDPVDERARELAGRAAERLSTAGDHAVALGDLRAGANLLGRATELHPDDARRSELLSDLGIALVKLADYPAAGTAFDEAARRAAVAGNACAAAYARLARGEVDRQVSPDAWYERGEQDILDALAVFEAAGDERKLTYATRGLATFRADEFRLGEAVEAERLAIELARRAGDRGQELSIVSQLSFLVAFGPTPVSEASLEVERLTETIPATLAFEQALALGRALLTALGGKIEESRAYLARSAAICRELGVPTHVVSLHATVLELIAGDPTRAEREARAAYDDLERLGETGWRSTVAALLALALAAQQLYEEAIHYSEISEDLGARRDVVNEVLWRLGRAEALAGLGDPGKAEQLAREAVEIVDKTDDIFYGCLSLATLARLLQAQGRHDEAATVAAHAVDRAERKEAPALVELARSALR